MRLFIQPVLGNRLLPDIGHPDLRQLTAHIPHLAVPPKQILGCLPKMMKDAMRDDEISQLPSWFEFRGENEPVPPPIEFLKVETQIALIAHIPRGTGQSSYQ